MTATHFTASTLLVAIDISKHRHEVLIGVPGKKRRRRMTITNTLEDFQHLVTALAGYDLPVRIGSEGQAAFRARNGPAGLGFRWRHQGPDAKGFCRSSDTEQILGKGECGSENTSWIFCL